MATSLSPSGGRPGDFSLHGQQRFRLFVRGEQFFGASAQCRVITPFVIQPRRALSDAFGEGQGGMGFFVRGGHGIG